MCCSTETLPPCPKLTLVSVARSVDHLKAELTSAVEEMQRRNEALHSSHDALEDQLHRLQRQVESGDTGLRESLSRGVLAAMAGIVPTWGEEQPAALLALHSQLSEERVARETLDRNLSAELERIEAKLIRELAEIETRFSRGGEKPAITEARTIASVFAKPDASRDPTPQRVLSRGTMLNPEPQKQSSAPPYALADSLRGSPSVRLGEQRATSPARVRVATALSQTPLLPNPGTTRAVSPPRLRVPAPPQGAASVGTPRGVSPPRSRAGPVTPVAPGPPLAHLVAGQMPSLKVPPASPAISQRGLCTSSTFTYS